MLIFWSWWLYCVMEDANIRENWVKGTREFSVRYLQLSCKSKLVSE